MSVSARKFGAAILCSLAVACSSDSPPAPVVPKPSAPTGPSTPAANSVVTAIAARPELSTLAAQVVAAGLDDDLSAGTNLTVFAPTNTAFARLTARTTPSNDDLAKILLYHVLSSKVMAADITAAGISAATLRDNPARDNFSLTAQLVGTQVLIGGQAFVTVADIQTDNGIVHIIDSVLWAPDDSLRYPGTIADVLADYPAFATLKAAVENESLLGAFNGTGACTTTARCTLFAPVESAFAALGTETVNGLLGTAKLPDNDRAYASDLAQILQYHVLASEVPAATAVTVKTARSLEGRYIGLGVTAGVLGLSNVDMATPSKVIGTNFFASNGVVHTISAVLVPPFRTLADLATGTGDAEFGTLGAAAADVDAGLVPALSGSATTGANCTPASPCTVFAPNNAAFARLVTALGLDDATELLDALGVGLQDVLLQHVAAGVADSTAVAAATSPITTLSTDKPARISVADGKVYVNTLTQVTGTDVIAANGILHTLDSVLYATTDAARFPGSIAAYISAYPIFATLKAAVVNEQLVGAFEDSDTSTCKTNARCTLFAPVESAFAALGNTVNDLLADAVIGGDSPYASDLDQILRYHVLASEVPAATAVTVKTAQSLEGRYIGLGVTGDVLGLSNVDMATPSNVTATNFFASNGVIHTVSAVLVPPFRTLADLATGTGDAGFATLGAAAADEDADLVPALSGSGLEPNCTPANPCTLFAPNNAAFGQLVSALGLADANALLDALGEGLQNVLFQHVADGVADSTAVAGSSTIDTVFGNNSARISVVNDKVYVNGATQVINTDVIAANGILHTLDSVLYATETEARFPGSIAQYLGAYPRLSTLLDSLVSSGAADTVAATCAAGGEGPSDRCTVFAPINEAFPGDLTAALAGRPLASVLAYHVLGTEYAQGALPASSPALQNGNVSVVVAETVSVTGTAGSTTTVIESNVFTSNGVLHLIDGILLYSND